MVEGQAFSYSTQAGRRWGYVHDLPGEARRQKRRRGWKTKKEALEALNRSLWEHWQIGVPPPEQRTVGGYLETWIKDRKGAIAGSTWRVYDSAVRLHLRPALGHVLLEDLRPHHLDAFYGTLRAKGLAPATQVSLHRILRVALSRLLARGVVSRDVWAGVDLPGRKRTDIHPLTPAELARLLRALDGTREYAPVLVTATTGLRIGELLALRWEDWQGDALEVARALSWPEKDKAPTFKQTKTEEARRIDLYPETIECLKAHRVQQRADQLRDPTWDTAGLIFPRVTGGPWRPSNLSSKFGRITRDMEGVPRIRFHDLRHTHASQLLAARVPIAVVSQRLGHASPEITMRIYAHMIPGQQGEAVTRGGEVFREAFSAARDHHVTKLPERPA